MASLRVFQIYLHVIDCLNNLNAPELTSKYNQGKKWSVINSHYEFHGFFWETIIFKNSCFNYSLELQRQKIDFQRALIRALAVPSLTWSPAEHEQIEFYRKKKSFKSFSFMWIQQIFPKKLFNDSFWLNSKNFDRLKLMRYLLEVLI